MEFNNETRGLRNNNPANIRLGDAWIGLSDVQSDTSFCMYSSVEYGIRAIYRTLITYRDRYGIRTVHGIISRWAPSNENNTNSYINAVCQYMTKFLEIQIASTTDAWASEKTVFVLILAIIKHENGIQPFNYEFIRMCSDYDNLQRNRR